MDQDFIHQEFRQIFQADQCKLRDFDAQDFSHQMKGRKLIMIGDSIMRLHFYSLACMMRSQVIIFTTPAFVLPCLPVAQTQLPGNLKYTGMEYHEELLAPWANEYESLHSVRDLLVLHVVSLIIKPSRRHGCSSHTHRTRMAVCKNT